MFLAFGVRWGRINRVLLLFFWLGEWALIWGGKVPWWMERDSSCLVEGRSIWWNIEESRWNWIDISVASFGYDIWCHCSTRHLTCFYCWLWWWSNSRRGVILTSFISSTWYILGWSLTFKSSFGLQWRFLRCHWQAHSIFMSYAGSCWSSLIKGCVSRWRTFIVLRVVHSSK